MDWYLVAIQSLMLLCNIWTAYELYCIRRNKPLPKAIRDEDLYV
jgi:hypothetical protein